MLKGCLITIEGIDGTGKSSIVDMLKHRFPDAVFTAEPTQSWIGDMIKRAIISDTDALAELFLFTADHAEHITKLIRPALLEGKLVISDRYSDSRYAYQGAVLSHMFEDAMEWVQSIHKGWSIVPDLTILLTIHPSIAISRLERRGNHTKFERLKFLKKVQENFLKLAQNEPQRFVVVDASQKLEKVAEDVEHAIKRFIRKHKKTSPKHINNFNYYKG